MAYRSIFELGPQLVSTRFAQGSNVQRTELMGYGSAFDVVYFTIPLRIAVSGDGTISVSLNGPIPAGTTALNLAYFYTYVVGVAVAQASGDPYQETCQYEDLIAGYNYISYNIQRAYYGVNFFNGISTELDSTYVNKVAADGTCTPSPVAAQRNGVLAKSFDFLVQPYANKETSAQPVIASYRPVYGSPPAPAFWQDFVGCYETR